MSYDPTLPTIRDRIRSIVGDTAGIETDETFPDSTYDAVIELHANWKLAAAEMAEKVAVSIEQDPTSYTATGDMSVGWGDRTRSLRAVATRLRAEAAEEDQTTLTGIVSSQLERPGGSHHAEYHRTWRGWKRWR